MISQRLHLETSVKHKQFFKRLSYSLRKKLIRKSILFANLGILLIVFAVFVHSSTSGEGTVLDAGGPNQSVSSDPLDQLSSSEVAVQVANMTGIAETTAVTNQSESDNAALNIVPADDQTISRQQVIATDIKTRQDISSYVVQPGDTLSSLAIKFGVTSNSIIWSNNLSGSTVTPGETLIIPPINGIVYTVKSGDTTANLAQTYNSNSSQITSFNDAELSGLVTGEQIVIPNGQEQTVQTYVSPTSFSAIYGGNGYDYGYCTWYVATQIAVPTNWGNASSWAYYAGLSGWTVSTTPTVGSIAQTAYAAGGQGHVGIVTAVSADGSQIKFKDMNDYSDGGGWGEVGYSGWEPASLYQHFITH